jgi:hypothetical protein
MDNSGKYMCPYTQDDVLAEWVDKAIQAKLGATLGKTVGAYAGQKALEQVPLLGGFLGSMAGEAAGRAIAIQAAGGWDFIKSTSDLSFNSVDNMAVYLYVMHSSHEHYQQALNATCEIYPELSNRYSYAIRKAPRRVAGVWSGQAQPPVVVSPEERPKPLWEVAPQEEPKAPVEAPPDKPPPPTESAPEPEPPAPVEGTPDEEPPPPLEITPE